MRFTSKNSNMLLGGLVYSDQACATIKIKIYINLKKF